jgi:hypothetical protein
MATQYEIRCYKIWCADSPDEFYVGSTKKTLSQRMTQHRKSARIGKLAKIYQAMREKGINSFQYGLLGSCEVSNMDEQRMFEQEYITRLQPTLNMIRAHTTEQEKVGDRKQSSHDRHLCNKDKINERHREYYESNKEHHNTRVREYRETRKDFFKDYQNQYRIDNLEKNKNVAKVWREKTKELRTCVCGSTYNYGKKSSRERHYRTEKHTNHVSLIYAKLRSQI